MKHSFVLLTIWLMASQNSYCQTSNTKQDEYAVKGTSLVTIKRPEAPVKTEAEDPPNAPPVANTEPAVMGKPVAQAKVAHVQTHTQVMQATSEVVKKNTEVLKKNTEVLQTNTEALEANIRAAEENMRLRSKQLDESDGMGSTTQKASVGPSSRVKNRRTKAVAPAQPPRTNTTVKTREKAPAALVAAPEKATPKTVAPATKPIMPAAAVSKAPEKPATDLAMAPAKEAVKPQTAAKPAVTEVAAVASVAIPKPKAQARKAHKAAAPAKAAAKQMPQEDQPAEAPAMYVAATPEKPIAKEKNVAVQLPKEIKIATVNSKIVPMKNLMHLPLLDKRFDSKTKNINYMPVAAKYHLKHGDMVTTRGYLQIVSIQDSAKQNETYSLQLTVKPAWGDSSFTVKIATDPGADVATRLTADNAKKFIREHFSKAGVPFRDGNLMNKPVYVTLTGKLVYSSEKAEFLRSPKPLSKNKRDRLAYTTAWEIDSISKIEFLER